ncbi:MAG: amidohydrolase family protein [Acidimicrobiia bacterium]|nr:amidohydrolase family protein [Acidimicrobiia bacterium]
MRTVFHGGQVFDATNHDIADGDVAVEDGRIVEVGTGLDGDDEVDCAGATVLPGFIDCHVHFTVSGNLDPMHAVRTPFSLRFFEAARNMQATLAAGITSIREAGGSDLGIKVARDQGLIDGPRMTISITALSQTGGHCDDWQVCGASVPTFGVPHPGLPDPIVDGPDQMRRKVRELVRAGADVIKVCTSGGVLSPRDDPRHGHFRDAELSVLVEEAAAAGIWVMAHAQATDGIKAAVRNGIRSIEHGIYLDDEAIEMMLDRGTYLVPTLMAPRGVLEAADAGMAVPPEAVVKTKMVMEAHSASISAAIAAGVNVAMGTDSGVTPHGRNLEELALMVECGMTPERALVATTRTAAELLGVEADVGTLEPGKLADMVLVDGDPRQVDTLPDRIRAVYIGGRSITHQTQADVGDAAEAGVSRSLRAPLPRREG